MPPRPKAERMLGKRWSRFYPEGMITDYAPPPETVCEMFAALIEKHADRPAIDYRDTLLSYRGLGVKAIAVARALQARGLGKGDVVALYLPNTVFHPIFFFGALLAGTTVTHLSPLDVLSELRFKCQDSGARIIVTLARTPFKDMASRLLQDADVELVVLCDEEQDSSPSDLLDSMDAKTISDARFLAISASHQPVLSAPLPSVLPGDIALLQYTGGTTGKPKAAILTHANLTAAVRIYLHWFAPDPQSGTNAIVLLVLPLFHIMALTSILMRRLNEGALLVIHQRFEAEVVISAIEQKRINGFAGVPTMWIALANHPGIEKRDLTSLERIGSGGAPLPVEIFSRIRDLTGHALRGGWGMTETCAAGTNLPIVPVAGKEASVGIPLPGIWLDIVAIDDSSRVLPVGETGEIRIRSPSVTAGYWNRPDVNVASFHDGHFLTGDIGWMDADGFFYLVDRKNDLIISSGYNVYPQAIENAIIEHPAVAEVMVIGVPDAYRGEAAKAFVVLRQNAEPFSLEELRAFLAERLGKHQIPQVLTFRASLPKTPVGKYSRKTLRDQEQATRNNHGT